MDGFLIIICHSTNHMLKAAAVLEASGVEKELIPGPPEYGSICSTAIKISRIDYTVASQVLAKHQVAVVGYYPYKVKKISKLMAKLERINNTQVYDSIKKLAQGEILTVPELAQLIDEKDEGISQEIISAADHLRQEIVGDIVDIRAAVEFSNHCSRNCLYCGIRKDNKNLIRYRMSPEEILEKCEEIKAMGIRTVILQSGEDAWYSQERIVKLVQNVKKTTGLRITLSIGHKSKRDLEELRLAGVNNYLLKIETCVPDLYQQIHPDSTFAERHQTTIAIKESGISLGTGNIIGLPKQTMADIAKDILYFKQMNAHMVGVGPFIPAKDTPLARYPQGSINLTLRTVALTRLILKNVYIPATTALATLDPMAQEAALAAGANTIMLILTPAKYRENYNIYNDKYPVGMDLAKSIVKTLGRKLPPGLREETV